MGHLGVAGVYVHNVIHVGTVRWHETTRVDLRAEDVDVYLRGDIDGVVVITDGDNVRPTEAVE